MGMLHAKARAESLEQQTRKQLKRYIRNDEKWHIRGEYLTADFSTLKVFNEPFASRLTGATA